MKNAQVPIDPETLAQVDRIGKPLGLKRSEIVRQALREWLQRRAVQSFEDDWIAAAQRRPDAGKDAEAWTAIQAWSKK